MHATCLANLISILFIKQNYTENQTVKQTAREHLSSVWFRTKSEKNVKLTLYESTTTRKRIGGLEVKTEVFQTTLDGIRAMNLTLHPVGSTLFHPL